MLNFEPLETFAMSILKRLSLCFLFVSLLLIPSFAQHFLGALSGLVLQVDTQIESPVQNNNVQILPEQKAGDTIQFQFFVPAGAGQSTNGYTVELDLPGKTFSSYIGNISGTDWTGGALISTVSTKLSALFPTGASVPPTGYLGQLDLQVTRSLEGGTLIVKSLSITSGNDVDVLDVSNAIITFTAPATNPGDFDGNGNVNLADFLAFVDVFGKSSSDVGFDARMDFDGNGNVNIADFLTFVEMFGTTYPTGGGQGGSGQGGSGQGGGDSSVIPPPPDNARYWWDPSIYEYRISWNPTPGATSYRVYYDSAFLLNVSCPGGCRRIATVSDTTTAHLSSHRNFRSIGYWVRACNEAGCSNYVRTAYVRASEVGGYPLPTTIIGLNAFDDPTGITYANDRFYVVDEYRNKVYAYMSSGQRDAASDFNLSPDNDDPTGVTYANDRFYVVDDTRDKVYAYMSSGQRDAASDFNLSPDNGFPEGITYANDRFYVVDDTRDKVYAYMSSGQRDAASDFNLFPDNVLSKGIIYANNRFYVVDGYRYKVYAYMSSGQRNTASDFNLSPDSGFPRGITYSNGKFYLVGRSIVYEVNP